MGQANSKSSFNLKFPTETQQLTDIQFHEPGYFSFKQGDSKDSFPVKSYDKMFLFDLKEMDKNEMEELQLLESLDLAIFRSNQCFVYNEASKFIGGDEKEMATLFTTWILPGRLRRIKLLRDSLPDSVAESDQLGQQILEIEQNMRELKKQVQ